MGSSSRTDSVSSNSSRSSSVTSSSRRNSSDTSERNSLYLCKSRSDSCVPRLDHVDSSYISYAKHASNSGSELDWLEYVDPISISEEEMLKKVPTEYEGVDDYSDEDWKGSLPATSQEFAQLFPSSRRLEIRHDDTTIDGNMNLTVDTAVEFSKGVKRNFTLFHLRMQDLRNREFSLRRYCRDSGREVCTSSRRLNTSSARTVLTGSFTHMLSSLKPTRVPRAKKQYSEEADYQKDEEADGSGSSERHQRFKAPSDIINLSFTNYAHVSVKRGGLKSSKHYDFEYWGVSYSWKRVVRNSFGIREISYHLLRRTDQELVAHILPERLTDDEAREETNAGGWVSPCTMWLSDRKLIEGRSDVPDVLVATGLVVLVDDSIRQHFRAEEKSLSRIHLPIISPIHVNLHQFGPKHILEGAFRRHERPHSRG